MGNDDPKDELIKKLLKEKEYLENKVAYYNELILVGLNNIGACSYMNAVLQCLLNTKLLTDYFLNKYKKDDKKTIIANEYYEVILNLTKKENHKKSYSATSFKDAISKVNPSFAGIAANDSKDLVHFLIGRLHLELNIANNNSINSNVNEDQTNEQMMRRLFLKEFDSNFK